MLAILAFVGLVGAYVLVTLAQRNGNDTRLFLAGLAVGAVSLFLACGYMADVEQTTDDFQSCYECGSPIEYTERESYQRYGRHWQSVTERVYHCDECGWEYIRTMY